MSKMSRTTLLRGAITVSGLPKPHDWFTSDWSRSAGSGRCRSGTGKRRCDNLRSSTKIAYG